MKTIDDARHEREMLEFQVDALLRRKGWAHTSTTPGCLWLWTKEVVWKTRDIIPGTRRFKTTKHTWSVMTDKSTALRIQQSLDEDEAAQQAGKEST